MLATIQSGAVIGVNAYPIAVEVDLSRGMMVFSTVGLPSSSVCEAKTRVKSALINAKEPFPQKRVVVNLAPAHIKKEGTAYDLPIALGILVAHERIPASTFRDTLVVGELSLDGSLRAIRGVLPLAAWARRQGVRRLLVPEENGLEAIAVEGLEVWVARDLQEVIRVARGESTLRCACPQDPDQDEAHLEETRGREVGWRRERSSEVIDMADVRGQEGARRALEVAAAGGHNLLFLGPPGSGKTMLARRLPSISPPLTFDERLESSIIASVSGLLRPEAPLIERRPFRAPHHTLSQVALAGGGPQCRPGEVSLAHNGSPHPLSASISQRVHMTAYSRSRALSPTWPRQSVSNLSTSQRPFNIVSSIVSGREGLPDVFMVDQAIALNTRGADHHRSRWSSRASSDDRETDQRGAHRRLERGVGSGLRALSGLCPTTPSMLR
jgi:magnesium chelatase family protein